MTTVDLDALRAARMEASGDGPKVKTRGKTFRLPPELPFEVPEALAEMARASEANDDHGISVSVGKALRALFGKDYERFRKTEPSLADVQELLTGVLKLYGLGSTGEPQASES